ncbi:hypothetical protein BABINDRAFT_64759 [Babjeviella inositovora NRRL Y-12698]|uniref:DH domain-containing protein n=1 Tax=Babjeviella inositovora NRRL Y-12698 TaxID=984486 RepID=A0A1E3QMD8_9ASCO|nr:uncharacterized protein BABINDRAFT_64759 [Babjeviella inositovora NRRL Y-12698]ODQ78879.1 hypothetical protein BABINDRAFT_64759 [Babjeviella inositovora NRRL Y-12698]
MSLHRNFSTGYYGDGLSTASAVTVYDNKIIVVNMGAARDALGRRTLDEWRAVLPSAAYFVGTDPKLFGRCLAFVYEDPHTRKLSTVLVSRHGESQYNSLTLDARSKYFPACENLLPKNKKSNVRRALAIANLRTCAILAPRARLTLGARGWDETDAGALANRMELVANRAPADIGAALLALGYLRDKFTNSVNLDVVYVDSEAAVDDNNRLVFLLGDQLDLLFDPLMEYSPEPTEKIYRVPSGQDAASGMAQPGIVTATDSPLAQAILAELFASQTSLTDKLVHFLQTFVVPLRIRVLNGEFPLTINAFNKIFPPTIDEITRVNCIFLESLEAAMPYGSFEVIKACGKTIPYFYKAYMRHEAATKTFSRRVTEFLGDHGQQVARDLPTVDLLLYTVRHIESIVFSSLNLIKLKMILTRLYHEKTDKSEREAATPVTTDQIETEMFLQMETFYRSALQTIDSFGRDTLKPYQRRVFTPTGKILTELADGWPVELQYGWLTRRVVGIFDATNLHTNAPSVIIVFSDHVLFLNVGEAVAPGPGARESLHRPSVSDILMHSLVNECPLENIPPLAVAGYAAIGGIHALTYDDATCIQFYVSGPGILGGTSGESAGEAVRTFRLAAPKLNSGFQVIELINKAKILDKSTSFHLFKYLDQGLSIYSIAHEIDHFLQETSRSPFALFLNTHIDRSYLQRYDLYLAVSACFLDDDSVQITGFSRGTLSVDRDEKEFLMVVLSGSLAAYLVEMFAKVYPSFMSHSNPDFHESLMRADATLVGAVETFLRDEPEVEVPAKSQTKSQTKPQTPQVSPVATPVLPHASPKPILKPQTIPKVIKSQPAPGAIKSQPVEKRPSFFKRLFRSKAKGAGLKPAKQTPEPAKTIKRKITKLFHSEEVLKPVVPSKSLSGPNDVLSELKMVSPDPDKVSHDPKVSPLLVAPLVVQPMEHSDNDTIRYAPQPILTATPSKPLTFVPLLPDDVSRSKTRDSLTMQNAQSLDNLRSVSMHESINKLVEDEVPNWRVIVRDNSSLLDIHRRFLHEDRIARDENEKQNENQNRMDEMKRTSPEVGTNDYSLYHSDVTVNYTLQTTSNFQSPYRIGVTTQTPSGTAKISQNFVRLGKSPDSTQTNEAPQTACDSPQSIRHSSQSIQSPRRLDWVGTGSPSHSNTSVTPQLTFGDLDFGEGPRSLDFGSFGDSALGTDDTLKGKLGDSQFLNYSVFDVHTNLLTSLELAADDSKTIETDSAYYTPENIKLDSFDVTTEKAFLRSDSSIEIISYGDVATVQPVTWQEVARIERYVVGEASVETSDSWDGFPGLTLAKTADLIPTLTQNLPVRSLKTFRDMSMRYLADYLNGTELFVDD